MALQALPVLQLDAGELVPLNREAHAMSVLCVAGISLKVLKWVWPATVSPIAGRTAGWTQNLEPTPAAGSQLALQL